MFCIAGFRRFQNAFASLSLRNVRWASCLRLKSIQPAMDGVNRNAAGFGVVVDMTAGIVAVSPGFNFVAAVANPVVADKSTRGVSAGAFAFDRPRTPE